MVEGYIVSYWNDIIYGAVFYLTARIGSACASGKIRTEMAKNRWTNLSFLDLALLASYAETKAVPVRTPVQSLFLEACRLGKER